MLTFLLFTNLASLVGVVAVGYALYRHKIGRAHV